MANTELGFTVQQRYPTEIDTSFPVKVTCPEHGMLNGQYVRATSFYSSPPQ